MTPGHLVTTDPSTAPQPPPAERCHHPRDQQTSASGRVSRVTCHVAGTLSPHCHRGPGARCDYITSGESHVESHSHITVTRHTGHTAAAGHTIVTLCHTGGHTHLLATSRWPGPAGSRVAARLSSSVGWRGWALLQCTHQPAHWAVARQLEPGSSNNHFITSDYPQPAHHPLTLTSSPQPPLAP